VKPGIRSQGSGVRSQGNVSFTPRGAAVGEPPDFCSALPPCPLTPNP
jgi:hypothetical protein